MIQAFVGLVGGGKSFCSTRRMMAYMARGGRVATNIRFTGWDEKISDLSLDSPVRSFLLSLGWHYQPKQYVYIPFDDMVSDSLWFKRIPQGLSRDKRTLCVVDEATDLFDTLDGGKLRMDSGYRELFHFLRLSRHAHIDILFVCQDLKSINTRLRGLVSSVWRSTDMKNFRVGIFRCGFPLNVFMLQEFDRSGKYEMSREFVKKDSRVFACYESETFGRSLGVKWDGVAVADGTVKKKSKEGLSMFWKILIVVSIVLQLVLFFCGSSSTPYDDSTLRSHISKIATCVQSLEERLDTKRETNIVSSVSAPSSVSVPVPEKPKPLKPVVLRGEYVFHQCGELMWIDFDGCDFRKGAPSEFGRVVLVSEHYTICVDDDGQQTILAPSLLSYEERQRRERAPLSRFISSDSGARRRAEN